MSRTRKRTLFRGAQLVAGICALSAVLTLESPAFAVPVRGSLLIPKEMLGRVVRDGTDRHYWKIWNGKLGPAPSPVDAGAMVGVALTGPRGKGAAGCSYRLQDGDLTPSTLVVPKSTAITIENTDSFTHQLTAEGVEGFSAIGTAPGNARRVQFARSGHFVIRDALFPHVEGHVHVLNDLVACGRVTSTGGFAFEDIEPGSYRLRVFFRGHELKNQPVVVPDGSEMRLEPIRIDAPSSKERTRAPGTNGT